MNIAATPLGGNSMKLTVEYYDDKAGRILSVPCTGTPKEIDDQVTKLPEGVQRLVRVALRRLREPEAQTPPRPAR